MPKELTVETIDKFINEVKKEIPSVTKIFEEATAKIPSDRLKKSYVEKNFSSMVVELERTAHHIYLKYEEDALLPLINLWLNANKKELIKLHRALGAEEFAERICRMFSQVAMRFEFRFGQMRKARAGRTFELLLKTLFQILGYPCEKPKKKAREELERIDMVIPDQETGLKRPDQALFIACKRTLRERWKQTIPEQKAGWTVYLITVDDELAEIKANEIHKKGVIAYVRDELKMQEHLKDKDWIRKLSDLPYALQSRRFPRPTPQKLI